MPGCGLNTVDGAPSQFAERQDRTTRLRSSLGAVSGDDVHDLPGDVPGWLHPQFGWLPNGPEQQSCAICASPSVEWVHPLNPDSVKYRVYGKGHTLPTFWTLCSACESIYQAGDDSALVEIMKASGHSYSETEEGIEQSIRQPLQVFRRSDLGSRRFGE